MEAFAFDPFLADYLDIVIQPRRGRLARQLRKWVSCGGVGPVGSSSSALLLRLGHISTLELRQVNEWLPMCMVRRPLRHNRRSL